ncbi:MAG: helix-turn-helix transcriptional regulator [Thermomicrobiales bacterium]
MGIARATGATRWAIGHARGAAGCKPRRREPPIHHTPPDLPAPASIRPYEGVEELSAREREVLGFLAARYSNKEIAHELGISPLTVKRHTINLYAKLGVSGRREAVRAYYRSS